MTATLTTTRRPSVFAPGAALVLAIIAFFIGPIIFSEGTQRCGTVWRDEYRADSTATAAKVRAADTVHADDSTMQTRNTWRQCVTDVKGANEGGAVMRVIGGVVMIGALVWLGLILWKRNRETSGTASDPNATVGPWTCSNCGNLNPDRGAGVPEVRVRLRLLARAAADPVTLTPTAYGVLLALAVVLAWVFELDRDAGGIMVMPSREWLPWPDTFATFVRWPHDKAYHFGASLLLTVSAGMLGLDRWASALETFGIAGLGWELQQWLPRERPPGKPSRFGHFSWRDLVADAAGCLVGLGILRLLGR
jgi:hypothetical protein